MMKMMILAKLNRDQHKLAGRNPSNVEILQIS